MAKSKEDRMRSLLLPGMLLGTLGLLGCGGQIALDGETVTGGGGGTTVTGGGGAGTTTTGGAGNGAAGSTTGGAAGSTTGGGNNGRAGGAAGGFAGNTGGTAGNTGGTAGSGNPGPGNAEPLFNSSVKPIMMAKCASSGCHTGAQTFPLKFLGAGPDTGFYASLLNYPQVTGGWNPAAASLLTKLAPGHQGLQDYPAAEKTAISGWLQAEAMARSTGGTGGMPGGGMGGAPTGGGAPDSRSALAEFSGCMTSANWTTAQMGTWANKRAEGGTVCASCHADGLQRFNTNADANLMFEANKKELFIIGFFTVRVNNDGTNTVVPAMDKLRRMGDGTTYHPTFDIGADNTHVGRLQQFYDLTMAAKTAGTCGAPMFPPPG
jgi:hypothetical protein